MFQRSNIIINTKEARKIKEEGRIQEVADEYAKETGHPVEVEEARDGRIIIKVIGNQHITKK